MTRSLTMRSLRDFARDERGTTAIEYAVIASGIACAIIAVVMNIGTSVQGLYQSVASNLH